MKLIIAILRDIDHDAVSQALTSAGFRVTLIASTGGFWRRGNTTLLIGCEDEQVEHAIERDMAPENSWNAASDKPDGFASAAKRRKLKYWKALPLEPAAEPETTSSNDAPA